MKRGFLACGGLLILMLLGGCSRPSTSGTNPALETPTPAAEVRSSADVVKVHPATVSIEAGGNAQGTVTLAISSGFHVNANPATFPYLIPTEITPGKIDGINVGKPVYPPGAKKQFKFADEPLAVYEGDAQIKLPVRAEKSVKPGVISMPLNVRVQACDHEQCFPPVNLNAKISIDVK